MSDEGDDEVLGMIGGGRKRERGEGRGEEQEGVSV